MLLFVFIKLSLQTLQQHQRNRWLQHKFSRDRKIVKNCEKSRFLGFFGPPEKVPFLAIFGHFKSSPYTPKIGFCPVPPEYLSPGRNRQNRHFWRFLSIFIKTRFLTIFACIDVTSINVNNVDIECIKRSKNVFMKMCHAHFCPKMTPNRGGVPPPCFSTIWRGPRKLGGSRIQ